MNLNINSPMYYTRQFGVIDEIYRMCRNIERVVKDKTYSPVIHTVWITPIIAPQDILDAGLFREIRKCEAKYGFASVSLQIDFEEFLGTDIYEKKKLIICNILKSIKSIPKRGKMNYLEFEIDILNYCEKQGIYIE